MLAATTHASSDESFPRLGFGVADLEDPFEHDDGEDLVDLVATAEDRQLIPEALETGEEPDHNPDPGAGEHRDLGEVEHDEPRLVVYFSGNGLPQLIRLERGDRTADADEKGPVMVG